MVKKYIALFAVFFLAAIGFAACRVYFASDASASENDAVHTSEAVAAAARMERLCCGIVSGSDISMKQSAFRTDFVPREPEYVERFRQYDGPKADFVPVLMYHFFYDANRLLEINFQNARVKYDTNNNLYITKKHSAGKVDMIFALIDAMYLIDQMELQNGYADWVVM